MRKRRKQTPTKKLQDKCEDLWKEYCYLRDGRKCQVKEHFPKYPLSHSKTMQVDHCFTRTNKHLFVDTRNGTCVCSSCNFQKNWDKKSVGRLIDEIVIKREGQAVFDEMKAIDLKGSPNPDWKNHVWLEQKAIELTLKWAELKNVKP